MKAERRQSVYIYKRELFLYVFQSLVDLDLDVLYSNFLVLKMVNLLCICPIANPPLNLINHRIEMTCLFRKRLFRGTLNEFLNFYQLSFNRSVLIHWMSLLIFSKLKCERTKN